MIISLDNKILVPTTKLSTVTIQWHFCEKCNNTHEYYINTAFIRKIYDKQVKIRCSVCGEMRRQINRAEQEARNG